MKKNLTRVASLFLCLFFVLSCTALAMESNCSENNQELFSEPRFEHMSRISSSLSFEAFGRANCTGSFTTYDEYNSKIIIVLQQFKNNRWNDYQSWSESYSGSGVKLLNKKYYVPSGYRYRVVTTAVILSNNGGELERVSCDSPVQEY